MKNIKLCLVLIAQWATLAGQVSAQAAQGVNAPCELDSSRVLRASDKPAEALPISLLDLGSSLAILERPGTEGYNLQKEPELAALAEKAHLAAAGGRVKRNKNVLTISAESGQQWCYVDHQFLQLPGLDGDGGSAVFQGQFGSTSYLRVDRYAMHDAPYTELINPRNGRILSFHVGNDAAALSPDGKRLLVVHASQPSGFSVAVPANDGPVIEIACTLPKHPYADPRNLSAEIRGWDNNDSFALVFKPKAKTQTPIALRVQRTGGKWQLMAGNPQALRQAGELRCHENLSLPTPAQACPSRCDKVALLTIAPALGYYEPLRRMFESAGDHGGEGHEAEIAAAKRQIELNLASARLAHGDRKLARTSNELGLAALRAGDASKAANRFEAAHQADPADVEILNNLGYAQLLTGSGNAGLHLVSALVLEPGRANAWANLGHLFARHEAIDEAVACLALALRFSGKPAKTLQLLKDLADKDTEPGLRRALQRLVGQAWVERLVTSQSQDFGNTA